MESQMTELQRLSRDHTAQLTGEQALPWTYRCSTRSYIALFKLVWHLQRLSISCSVSLDKFSHLTGPLKPHSQYLNRFSTRTLNVIAVYHLTLLVTLLMLYSHQRWVIGPQIDLLPTSPQHTAINLILPSKPSFRSRLGKGSRQKVLRQLPDRYTYNPWLNADIWDVELSTEEWSEFRSKSAYINTLFWRDDNFEEWIFKKLILIWCFINLLITASDSRDKYE